MAPKSCGGQGADLQYVVGSTTYIDGADEILVAGKQVGQGKAEDDGKDPSSEEALDGFLGADFDELGAAESDATDVGKDVIGDDQRCRQEEPDHALKDVVHDKVGLADDQIESHVGPSKLGELELVMTLLQGHDEEDET